MKQKVVNLSRMVLPLAFYGVYRMWVHALMIRETVLAVGSCLIMTLISVRILNSIFPDQESAVELPIPRPIEQSIPEFVPAPVESAKTPAEASDILRSLAQEIAISPFEEKKLDGINAYLRIWPSSRQLSYQLVFNYFLRPKGGNTSLQAVDFHWGQLLEQTEIILTQTNQGYEVELAFPIQECSPDEWVEFENILQNFAMGSKEVIEYHLENAFPGFIVASVVVVTSAISAQEFGELMDQPSSSFTDELVDYISGSLDPEAAEYIEKYAPLEVR